MKKTSGTTPAQHKILLVADDGKVRRLSVNAGAQDKNARSYKVERIKNRPAVGLKQ